MTGAEHTHAMPSQMAGTRGRTRAFLLHLGEMMLAMIAGMVVLGGLLEAALAVGGSSMSHAPIAVAAGAMAFNMTAPMAWWMRRRGHPARHNLEMAGSMIVPTALAIAAYWLGAIAEDSVLAVQHAVMIPAMVGVMLARRDHYAT